MRFAYWTVGEDTATHYAVGDSITLTAESTVLKANWTNQTHTVTLKAGDGTGDDQSSVFAKGAVYTLPENPFTAPVNQKFDG